MGVGVQAHMGDHEGVVVRVVRLRLMDDAHHAPDELDVRRQACERPEDGRDAQGRMIEAFAEHLHLHDAIELAAAQIGKNGVLLVSIHLTIDFGRLQAPLFVQPAHLAGMVDGTGNGDDLVTETTALSQLLEVFDAGVDDVTIALGADATPRRNQACSRKANTSSRVCRFVSSR